MADTAQIDFGRGQPDFEILPLEVMRKAAAVRLAKGDTTFLQYGAEEGSARFRRCLAEFLTNGYGTEVTPESLFITAGASHGLDIVCGQYTKPGDTIYIEEPTYFHALKILKGRGLDIVPIPCDGHGLSVDELEAQLDRTKPKLLYTIPTFHNPSGTTLPVERRERLVALAREHGFMIVADEVYQLLGYRVAPPPLLLEFARGDDVDVVSLGSFSKILAPGVRLGWAQTSPRIVDRLANCGVRRSGGGVNPFTQAIVRAAIEEGLQAEYLDKVRAEYQARSEILYDALVDALPDSVRFERPDGGYFIWLELPPPLEAEGLLDKARSRGISFKAGPEFTPRPGLSRHFRLCFAFHDRDTLKRGAAELGRLVREELSDQGRA